MGFVENLVSQLGEVYDEILLDLERLPGLKPLLDWLKYSRKNVGTFAFFGFSEGLHTQGWEGSWRKHLE